MINLVMNLDSLLFDFEDSFTGPTLSLFSLSLRWVPSQERPKALTKNRHLVSWAYKVGSECLGPPGSKCQDRVKRARDLLEETPVKDKEERSRRMWESLGLQCNPDTCERRGGRKEDWAGGGSDFRAVSEKVSDGLMGSSRAKTAH